MSYGSAGAGSTPHLAGELFKQQAGFFATHIPYRGAAPALQDLLAGQLDYYFDPGIAFPHVRAGKLKMLAVASSKRSALFPEVPTLAEAGLKGFDIGTWFGVLAPAATPKEIVARLSAETMKIIHSPEFRKRMDEIGAEPIGDTPEQMARQIKEETEKFARLVKEAKVTIE